MDGRDGVVVVSEFDCRSIPDLSCFLLALRFPPASKIGPDFLPHPFFFLSGSPCCFLAAFYVAQQRLEIFVG